MRSLTIGLALLFMGCASPRDKDCKELLPKVDAAHAKPTSESAASLRAFTPQHPPLRDPTAAYAKAVQRQADAAKALEELIAALKLRKGDGPPFKMEMFDPSRPHAERLLSRCFPANPPADCALLARALEECINPASDDTTAEEQLLTCANGFAAVKSDDAATNESIQALARTMRDLEPFARNVGAPAKEVISVAKKLSPKIQDAQKAKADANAAEMEIRAVCQPGTRGGTRGPS